MQCRISSWSQGDRFALAKGPIAGSLRSLRSGRQRACDPWQGDSPPVGEPNSGGGSPLSPRRPSNRRVVCRRCAVGAPRAGDMSIAPQVRQVTWVGDRFSLGKFGRTGTVKDRLLYNEGPIP